MAIVTISRELEALGEETARELSLATGFRLIDRGLIERRLGEHGCGAAAQQKYDEKRPGLWASLAEGRAAYLELLKLALYEEASLGDCIVMGRGGAAVFRAVPDHLAIRFVAPLELRVERAMREFSCDERQARQVLGQSDHDRGGFSRIYFDFDWADPRAYELVLNTARLDPPKAARMAESCMGLALSDQARLAGGQALADLLLAQRVMVEIICSRGERLGGVSAKAERGVVVLSGLANTKAAIDAALAAARAVPGVLEARSDMHLVQEYNVIP
jgi:cytidylate kinase